MAADFKSHVLLRDEKGLFGIPFKRLLLAGVGGGMTYTIFNLAVTGWSIPCRNRCWALPSSFFTAPRGGIPLWNRLILPLSGNAVAHRGTFSAKSYQDRLVQAMELPVELVRLEGSRVFAPPTGSMDIDLREWITFAYAAENRWLDLRGCTDEGGAV